MRESTLLPDLIDLATDRNPRVSTLAFGLDAWDDTALAGGVRRFAARLPGLRESASPQAFLGHPPCIEVLV